MLGVAVVGLGPSRDAWRQWTAPSFDVESKDEVSAGIDGEAVRLEPPLHFRMRPAVLHVRIARAHPGASPSAIHPEGAWAGARALAAIVAGHDGGPDPARAPARAG